MWSELKLLWLLIRYLNKIGKVWEPLGTFATVFDRGVVASVLCTQRFWNLLVTWAVRVVAARDAVGRNAATHGWTPTWSRNPYWSMLVYDESQWRWWWKCSGAHDRQKLREVMHGVLWKLDGEMTETRDSMRLHCCIKKDALSVCSALHHVLPKGIKVPVVSTFARSRSKLLSNC